MPRLNVRAIELEPLVIQPGSDADVLGVYRVGGIFLSAVSVFGALMTVVERDLTPRARAVAAMATGASFALGARASVDPAWFGGFTHQRRLASALPWAGVMSMWASEPMRSPMFMPSIILTSIGTAKVGARTGAGIGLMTSGLYLGGVLVSQRNHLSDKKLLWNVGVTAGYTTAGYVSPLLSQVAFSVRALEHARRRDRQVVDPSVPSVADLMMRAEKVGAKAQRIDEALVRLQQVDLPTEQAREKLRDATEHARAKAVAYGVAPILMRAARGESISLTSNLRDIIDAHRRVRRPIPIDWTSNVPSSFAVDGRATATAVRVLQNALANAFAYGGGVLTRVRVDLHDAGGQIILTIDDDGGGTAPALDELGHGLRGARAACSRLGGELVLDQLAGGVRVRAWIPCRTQAPAGTGGSVIDQIDDTIAAIARMQTFNTWWQGINCVATADRRSSAMISAVALTSLTAMNYRREQRRDSSPWSAAAHIAALSALWPHGGLPPSGLAGNALLIYSVGARSRGLIPTVAASAVSAAAAWRVRATVARPRIIENVAFLPVCAAMGMLGGRFARDRLISAEAETGSLRDRADMVEQATDAGSVVHDLISPLRRVPGWWSDLKHRPEATEVVELVAEVTALMRDLSLRVEPVDPLEEFQRYIATILAPTLVTVNGELPEVDRSSADVPGPAPHARGDATSTDLSADRARSSLYLIALADAVAAHILDSYPISLRGNWSLERVHIHVAPESRDPSSSGPGRVEIVIQPIPPRQAKDGHNARMQRLLLRIPGGEFKEGFDDARRTFLVAAEVLDPRRGD